MEFNREKTGPHGESLGQAKLYVNDKAVAQGFMKTARDPSRCLWVIRLSGSASRLALVQPIALLAIEGQRAVPQQSPQ